MDVRAVRRDDGVIRREADRQSRHHGLLGVAWKQGRYRCQGRPDPHAPGRLRQVLSRRRANNGRGVLRTVETHRGSVRRIRTARSELPIGLRCSRQAPGLRVRAGRDAPGREQVKALRPGQHPLPVGNRGTAEDRRTNVGRQRDFIPSRASGSSDWGLARLLSMAYEAKACGDHTSSGTGPCYYPSHRLSRESRRSLPTEPMRRLRTVFRGVLRVMEGVRSECVKRRFETGQGGITSPPFPESDSDVAGRSSSDAQR